VSIEYCMADECVSGSGVLCSQDTMELCWCCVEKYLREGWPAWITEKARKYVEEQSKPRRGRR